MSQQELTRLSGPVILKLHSLQLTKQASPGSLRHGVTTHNWFEHYLWDIYGGFGHNGKRIQRTLPSMSYSAIMLQMWLPGPVFETSPTLVRETCACKVSDTVLPPIIGVAVEHYLWDIYGGFGHNGKTIQPTLPSHTQPSRSKLAVLGQVFETSHTSETKHVHESLRHGVTTHNWFVALPLGHIWRLWAQWEDNSTAPFPPILSHHAPIWLPGPVFETSHPTSEQKHVHESLRHGVTTHNWFVHYLWDIYGGFGHNGKTIQRTLPSHTQPSCSKLATAWASF